MNPLLASIYGTTSTIEKVASQVAAPEATEEEQLNAYVVGELEKQASAAGFDLSTLSDEEFVSAVEQYKQELVKEASAGADAGGEQLTEAQAEAISMGDLAGRAQAHAFFDEITSIQETQASHEKLAGLSDEEILDGLATQRAENMLAALNGDGEGFMKEASMEISEDLVDLDDLVTMRAAEMLDAAGWDVEAICAALEG